jgi:hypothetical protein
MDIIMFTQLVLGILSCLLMLLRIVLAVLDIRKKRK